MELSDDARRLLKMRYCRGEETPEDVYSRVASALGTSEGMEEEFFKIMNENRFLPNSPCLRNAGYSNVMSACFILDIEDSMDSIFSTLKASSLIYKAGGGVGINFSPLREEGSILSSGGSSSGVMSFLRIFDAMTDAVKSGGFRRGAGIAVMYPDHPEIYNFIKAKVIPDSFKNFNFSIMLNDDFMKRIKDDDIIYLRARQDKRRVIGKLKCRDLFGSMAFAAWMSGDPGCLFFDRINKDNIYFPRQIIECVNPCLSGETLIYTTNGEIKIRELAKTRSKTADVYCCSKNGELEIRKAINIRVSKGQGAKPEKVIEVITTKGKLVCTPEHKILTKNRGWIEAKNLDIGEKLVALNKGKRGLKYIGIRLNIEPQANERMEHKFISSYYFGEELSRKYDVHHIDGDTHNNKISNLQLIPHAIHASEQRKGNKDYSRNFITNRFSSPLLKKTRESRKTGRPSVEERVIKIRNHRNEIVYDMEVPEASNFIANGIVVHNCGEVPGLAWENCCLGSVNLNEHIEDNDINWDKFKETIQIGARFLLAIKKLNEFPIDKLYIMNAKTQRIGLGLMGYADALLKMHIKYDSNDALKLIGKIGSVMREEAKIAAPQSAAVLSIAPTGSLSILASCSPSIEPIYSADYERRVIAGTFREERAETEYLRTAHEISPEWHLKIQAEFQKYIDNGVSKTVNLPYDASVQNVYDTYIMAYEMGCKGITVYRDQSKDTQVYYDTSKQKCNGDVCYL